MKKINGDNKKEWREYQLDHGCFTEFVCTRQPSHQHESESRWLLHGLTGLFFD
jgi:hypothetical protein